MKLAAEWIDAYGRLAQAKVISRPDGNHLLSAPVTLSARIVYPAKLMRWRWHYVGAVAAWVMVIAISVVIATYWHFSRNTLITLAFHGANPSGGSRIPQFIFLVVMVFVLARPSSIRRAALREEVQYRTGSERWSWPQRLWSCFRFGLIHIWNLVVPISVVIALMAGGFYLMAIYLRAYKITKDPISATAVSTRAHVAYNRVGLAAIAVAVGIYIAAS